MKASWSFAHHLGHYLETVHIIKSVMRWDTLTELTNYQIDHFHNDVNSFGIFPWTRNTSMK